MGSPSLCRKSPINENRSIAGVSIEISNARLDAFQVDGGFNIAGVPSDSVGILYPGERVDLIVQWDENAMAEGSSLTITLDQEYNFLCLLVQHSTFLG